MRKFINCLALSVIQRNVKQVIISTKKNTHIVYLQHKIVYSVLDINYTSQHGEELRMRLRL